jgi:AcrR family transcriptional regulator
MPRSNSFVMGGSTVDSRSLYYHFDSKDQLLAAVRAAYHELALGRIEKRGVSRSSDPDVMLDTLFAELARLASRPRFTGSGFTRLVLELADLLGHPARAIARHHEAAVEAWFASELAKKSIAKPSELAGQVAPLVEGVTSPMLIHGKRR